MNKSISSDLYLVIKTFLVEIFKLKVVESKHDSTITVEQYIDRYTRPSLASSISKYTIGLPGKIMEWIRGKNDHFSKKIPVLASDSAISLSVEPIIITKEESDIIEAISECINTEQDFKKSNKFIIRVEMQDPLVVAQVTSSVVKILRIYIIEYRTKS